MMAASFLSLAMIPKAHAAGPTLVQDVAGTACGLCNSVTVTLTSTTANNLIVALMWSDSNSQSCSQLTAITASWTLVAPFTPSGTDLFACYGLANGGSTSLTFTITSNAINVEVFEFSGMGTSTLYTGAGGELVGTAGTGTARAAPNFVPSPTSVAFAWGLLCLNGSTCGQSWGSVTSGWTASNGDGMNVASPHISLSSEYVLNDQAVLDGARTFTQSPAAILGYGGFWIGTSAVSTTTTTATTTVTTQATVTNALLQVGGIPANSSSFALFSKTPEMIYVQNPVASAASLTNVTLKLAATDITSSTAILYLGLYQQNNPNQVPSASNPMQLINPTISYNIANGTTGFIHVPIAEIQINGPITICGFCYWGIGIWTNGNHSSGASNSGVYLYQASVANTVGGSAPTDALCGSGQGHPGYPWEYLPNQATSVGLPSNWYFIACSLQKNLAYVAFVSYGVAIVYAGSITQTVTTATTITLSTGTTTVTTTANQASQTVIQGANFYLAMTLIVGIFMVGLWAGGLGGGMLGAIIGEIAAIAAGVFTPGQATLILVSTLIGCAAAFGLGQGTRGRGFGL